MDWAKKYEEWATADLEGNLVKELHELTDRKEIEDRFYRYLEFGTGGMRGELGAGTNRMNSYSIRRVATGLAKYILTQGKEAIKSGVVISYDNRQQSDYFASWTARIIASYGIQVYLSDELRPTPELSFLVRKFKAFSGVMITASHNPAQYNGFKVYDQEGGQITLDTANQLTMILSEITNELSIQAKPLDHYIQQKLVKIFSRSEDQNYLRKLDTVIQNPEMIKENASQLKIVYTPLHGTGLNLVTSGLARAGFEKVTIVNEQATKDCYFSTVQSPNPENREAFTLAIELGHEIDADILLATDPDADRLGVAVNTGAGFTLLSGNQIGVLLLDYLLKSKKEQKSLTDFFLAKTIVTSDLGSALAESYGVETRNTLTGFKFIGEQIRLAEERSEKQFLFGYEESYGYLISPFVRDKDAIQAAVLLSEVALFHKLQGTSLIDVLQSIYLKYGYYVESLETIDFKGKTGQEILQKKMKHLRQLKTTTLGNEKLAVKQDYLDGVQLDLSSQKETKLDLPKSDVLKLIFHDGSWICIRPSGTEPKCKIYLSFHDSSSENAHRRLEKVKEEILCVMKES